MGSRIEEIAAEEDGKWPLKLREWPSVNRSSELEVEVESIGREKMSKELVDLLAIEAKIMVFGDEEDDDER